ncbi:MAG TPA: hypothetical protein VKU02_00850 [Gemmataceae bacterium]|nr:hypothetical protein [Gemmataceae bacterium]
MNSLRRTVWSVVVLAGALLLPGCSPNTPTPSKPAPAPKPEPTPSSPPARTSGGSASGGAIQAVRGAVKRVGDESELRNFATAYMQEALTNGRGPSNVQEIRTSLTPKMVKAFDKDGDYVVNWGLQNPSGSTILAYAKDPDQYGLRLVAKGDGAVVRMSKEEFEQAKSRR